MIDEDTEFGRRVAQHLREETVVWLTTVTPPGTPLPRPVGFLWDGADTVFVYSQPGARVRNIRHNPKVTLNFGGDGSGGDIVVLAGTAEVDSAGVSAADNPAWREKYAAEGDPRKSCKSAVGLGSDGGYGADGAPSAPPATNPRAGGASRHSDSVLRYNRPGMRKSAHIDVGGLTREVGEELDSRLKDADAALAAQYPGDRGGRQPVHTVYVPADRYHARTVPEWGTKALQQLDTHADLFAELVGDEEIVARVRRKLAEEPVEDLRIDFEDGYGTRPDDAEDTDAASAAASLARSRAENAAPPFAGIRIKSLERPTRRRAVRTCLTFLGALADAGDDLDGPVITLPKVTSVEQVEAMVHLCERAEQATGAGRLRFEIQVETPQSILGPDGAALVARMIHAADGRCTGLHYGTYDYSAFCGIAAPYQSLAHPVADHAKLVMQAAAAGTGVRLSDGSTNRLPIGDPAAVRRGWEEHLQLVRRSLERGYYQGWDLHPAQLPTRFAATFGFYRDGLADATRRLRDYVERTGEAILDEPATARALADYALRALHCGAATAAELEATTTLDRRRLAELARPGR